MDMQEIVPTTQEEMMRAIQILDQLLLEFALRSGGGFDCLLIREAEEAIRFLRSLLKKQEEK